MGKIQILDKIPVKPAVIPVQAASSAFDHLNEAHHEYKKIAAVEKTKREAISAWKDVRLAELKNQQEILRAYLEYTFKERHQMIDGLFDALDKGLDTNNSDAISLAINGIVSIAKDSPLQQVDNWLSNMKNDDVKVLEF